MANGVVARNRPVDDRGSSARSTKAEKTKFAYQLTSRYQGANHASTIMDNTRHVARDLGGCSDLRTKELKRSVLLAGSTSTWMLSHLARTRTALAVASLT